MSSAAILVHVVIISYVGYFNNMPIHLFLVFTLGLLQSIFHTAKQDEISKQISYQIYVQSPVIFSPYNYSNTQYLYSILQYNA